MPISQSAKKSLRQARTKHDHNVEIKTLLKRAIKDVNAENASDVFSRIDKAVKLNLIHHNKASRLKARIAKSLGNVELKPKSTAGATVAKVAKKSKTTATKTVAKKPVKATTKTATSKASPKKTKKE